MNPILTTCSVWHHKDGGRYNYFPKIFDKFAKRPNIDKIQFMGVAGTLPHPIFTVARPVDVESVLTLSSMNTTVSGAPVLWIGAIKCYKIGTGLKYYIPTSLHTIIGEDAKYAIFCMAKTSKMGIPILVLNTKGMVPSYVDTS